jgi:hypothetical protein
MLDADSALAPCAPRARAATRFFGFGMAHLTAGIFGRKQVFLAD